MTLPKSKMFVHFWLTWWLFQIMLIMHYSVLLMAKVRFLSASSYRGPVKFALCMNYCMFLWVGMYILVLGMLWRFKLASTKSARFNLQKWIYWGEMFVFCELTWCQLLEISKIWLMITENDTCFANFEFRNTYFSEIRPNFRRFSTTSIYKTLTFPSSTFILVIKSS